MGRGWHDATEFLRASFIVKRGLATRIPHPKSSDPFSPRSLEALRRACIPGIIALVPTAEIQPSLAQFVAFARSLKRRRKSEALSSIASSARSVMPAS